MLYKTRHFYVPPACKFFSCNLWSIIYHANQSYGGGCPRLEVCFTWIGFSFKFPHLALGFSNTRTPSPPWIHVVRLVVPMSCCNDAASHLVKALGGADVARRVVGGVKWWQVRGIKGLSSCVISTENSPFTFSRVDAQWITTKKDWQEAKRRHKMQQAGKDSPASDGFTESDVDSGAYSKEMDRMRCILYIHGGTS
jgi:hypothetical protein